MSLLSGTLPNRATIQTRAPRSRELPYRVTKEEVKLSPDHSWHRTRRKENFCGVFERPTL